jgi:Tfp pilus assembly protein PilO
MSDYLDKRIDDLEALIRAQTHTPHLSSIEQSIDKSSKYIRWLQSIIALAIVVVGMGVTWGLTQGKITTLETEVTTLKETVQVERILTKEERNKLHTDLITMQVKQASVDQLLNGIREDVAEIKEDVKKLTRGR